MFGTVCLYVGYTLRLSNAPCFFIYKVYFGSLIFVGPGPCSTLLSPPLLLFSSIYTGWRCVAGGLGTSEPFRHRATGQALQPTSGHPKRCKILPPTPYSLEQAPLMRKYRGEYLVLSHFTKSLLAQGIGWGQIDFRTKITRRLTSGACSQPRPPRGFHGHGPWAR